MEANEYFFPEPKCLTNLPLQWHYRPIFTYLHVNRSPAVILLSIWFFVLYTDATAYTGFAKREIRSRTDNGDADEEREISCENGKSRRQLRVSPQDDRDGGAASGGRITHRRRWSIRHRTGRRKRYRRKRRTRTRMTHNHNDNIYVEHTTGERQSRIAVAVYHAYAARASVGRAVTRQTDNASPPSSLVVHA